MEEAAGVISGYVETLGRWLAFDPSLARSACREVEDHLREAVAAEPIEDPVAAESSAVVRFGDPRALAAELAELAVARGNRRASAVAILVIAAAFAAMKLRLAWYAAAAAPAMRDDLRAVSQLIGQLDRYAFWTAGLIGIGTWIYIIGRGDVAGSAAACRRRQRRFLQLCAAAVGALIVSVAADSALTALRMQDANLVAGLVPVLSMAIEVAGVSLLVECLRRMRARLRGTAALLDA